MHISDVIFNLQSIPCRQIDWGDSSNIHPTSKELWGPSPGEIQSTAALVRLAGLGVPFCTRKVSPGWLVLVPENGGKDLPCFSHQERKGYRFGRIKDEQRLALFSNTPKWPNGETMLIQAAYGEITPLARMCFCFVSLNQSYIIDCSESSTRCLYHFISPVQNIVCILPIYKYV